MKSTEIKENEYVSYVQYGKVIGIGHRLTTVLTDGKRISFNGDFEFGTSQSYTEEVKVSRTELVEKLGNAWNMALSIYFRKKPQTKDLTAAVSNLNKGKFPTNKEIENSLKKVMEGTPRLIQGHLLPSKEFGRILVNDLENGGPRWVDLRTIEYSIFGDTKYVVK